LEKDAFCETLYQNSNNSEYQLCLTVYDGINELGLEEVLNYILRESQLIVNNFRIDSLRSYLIWLLQDSRLNEIETVMDYFTSNGLYYERVNMINQIKAYAQKLFNIFDILFSVFVSVCFLIAVFGVLYIIRQMQKKIIQIYHIVLLIPYGERTKRELNELLKITL